MQTTVKSEGQKDISLSSLLGVVGISLLFLGIAYLGRSLLLFTVIAGLGSAFVAQSQRLRRNLAAAMISPFLPFALAIMPIALVQPKFSDSLWLLSITASYFVARLLRLSFPITWLAGGAIVTGIVMESVRLGSQVFSSDLVSLLSKLSDLHHKNLIGWAVSIGLIFSVYLARLFTRQLLVYICAWTAVAVLSILLFLADSFTSILASIAGLLLMGILSPTFGGGAVPFSRLGAWKLVTLGIAAGFAMLATIANLFEFPSPHPLSRFSRESNLTGRTDIWECYAEAMTSGVEQVREFVSNCSGIGTNLHSSFLEAHLLGGWLLVLTVVFGFVFSIGLGIRRAVRAKDLSSRRDGALEAAIAIATLLIALAESYLFSRFSYLSLIVFMASGVASQHTRGLLSLTIARLASSLNLLSFWRRH